MKAYAFFSTHNGALQGFRALAMEATAEELAIAARLPKWVGVRVYNGKQIVLDVYFTPTKGNAKNETGAKRVRRFLAEFNVEWNPYATNCYATREEFEAAL